MGLIGGGLSLVAALLGLAPLEIVASLIQVVSAAALTFGTYKRNPTMIKASEI